MNSRVRTPARRSGGRRGKDNRRSVALVLVAALVALSATPFVATSLSATSPSSAAMISAASPTSPLHATIRRTSHGIPHILADDYAGLGFGYGYALAQDNLCVLADIYTTVNGERSRYFGPDGSWSQGGNGTAPNNLNSDFFFQRIKDKGIVEDLASRAPPHGPGPELKEGVRGYVAGYNKYLRETGVDNLPDATCRGKPWVRELTEMDAYRRFYQLGLIASSGVVIDGIGSAQPLVGPPPPAPTQADLQRLGEQLPLGGIGSNAIALGPDATDNRKGMLLGNPHFPWDGSERFYEAQLTIPGVVNAEGGSLMGVPVINIGHTDGLAWSHTVSTAYRFTPFEERLAPDDPHSYIYDGAVRPMTADDVTVKVKNPDDSLSDESRTLYSTHHGPIFTDLLGVPLPWTNTTAFSMGDANAANFRYLNHFFEVNHAQEVAELEAIIQRNQGVPWVNTIASDKFGDAYYADHSVTPHVTNDQANACNTELGRATFGALGLPILDGSLSTCEWASPAFGGPDPDAVDPGTFGPSHMPELHRPDYVTNSNDSYWLSNPQEPLEGFARIIGDERTERALRTRSGLVMVEERLAGTDGWSGNRYTLQQLQDTVFANRQYAGELWRDGLATFCETTPVMMGSSGPVNVSDSCIALRDWDLHDDLDSQGAILFRRFATRALGAVPVVGTPGLFVNQFDANDAVHTPNGLNITSPAVQQAYADAVTDLRNAGIPFDAPLRDWQYERRGSVKIPIHGGPGTVGVFNAINVGWTGSGPNAGYSNVPHGSSFVMAAQFTDDPGCPVDARTILTYSQSTNPSSPYFADQTHMFSNKQWVDERFCESEIASDPNLEVTEIEEQRTYPRPGSGTPLRVPLVPEYEACTTPDSVHVAPLTLPACTGPRLASSNLTTSSTGKGSGFARLNVQAGDPDTMADEADIAVTAQATDVRNSDGGGDYTGRLALATTVRLTDAGSGGTGDVPGTVHDFELGLPVDCAATPNPTLGANCSLTTTLDTLVPGMAREGARSVLSSFSVKVLDPGADAALGGECPPTCGTGDEQVFLRQGVLMP
jgi:acyl-homoserine-lactone acylase